MKILVHPDDFDAGHELKLLSAGRGAVGAVACFVGLVRDVSEGEQIGGMELEHYPGMTEKSLRAIALEAQQRWEIIDLTIIHRVGALLPADQIVLVAVASSHRGEAFAACEFIMDYLKTRAPFWKREHTATGSRWVDARETDQAAAGRWADKH